MTLKKLAVAAALLLSATSIVLAQSQQNCAPGAPMRGDCFGQPYGGSAGSRCVCPHYGGGYDHRWR
jgi:hypothetical protein